MEEGSVELELEILECTFNEKQKYSLVVTLQTPSPSVIPKEPEKERKRLTKERENLILLRSDLVGPTSEPRFLLNKFVFLSPTLIRNSTEEILVFELKIEVFSTSVENNRKTPFKSLLGESILQSNKEISSKLLKAKTASHILYVSKVNTESLLGSIMVNMKLKTSKTTTKSQEEEELQNFVLNRQTNDSKLISLASELKMASEIHLKALNEANKFNTVSVKKYLDSLTQDMNSKTSLINKLLVDINQKDDQINSFQMRLSDERKKVKVLDGEVKKRMNNIRELERQQQIVADGNSYQEITRLQTVNIQLLKKQKRMRELENAHEEQSKVLLQFQKKVRNGKKYKKICQKQELIIKKLERLMKNEYHKRGNEVGKSEKKNRYIHELKNKSENLEDELKIKIDRIQSLQEEIEVKDERLKVLERELEIITKKSAKEISLLRIKLANHGIDYNVEIEDEEEELFVDENVNAIMEDVINEAEKEGSSRKKKYTSQRSTTQSNSRYGRSYSKRSNASSRKKKKNHVSRKVNSIIDTNFSFNPMNMGTPSALGSEYDDISLPPLSRFGSEFNYKTKISMGK